MGQASAQSGTEPAAFPVTVENCGRTWTFEEPPSRVVTGYHPAFEILVALGLGEGQIIGRTNFSENGPRGFLPGQKAVYDAIPEVSPTTDLPGKEALLALEWFFGHVLCPLVVAVAVPLISLAVLFSFHWALALALAPWLLGLLTVPAWLRQRGQAQGLPDAGAPRRPERRGR